MNNNLEQLHDIYSVWHVPYWQTSWFFWGCTVAGTLTFILLFWAFYRYFLKKKEMPIPYWQQALNQITSLQKKQYRTKGDAKNCYFVLTSVMKQYLHKRYDFPITAQTDNEAARYIEKQSLSNQLKNDLNGILKGCLLIKFANEQALEDQIRKHLDAAHLVVKTTLPERKSTP